eukprot:1149447-Pelagomonas_calceolata.AAC.9
MTGPDDGDSSLINSTPQDVQPAAWRATQCGFDVLRAVKASKDGLSAQDWRKVLVAALQRMESIEVGERDRWKGMDFLNFTLRRASDALNKNVEMEEQATALSQGSRVNWARLKSNVGRATRKLSKMKSVVAKCSSHLCGCLQSPCRPRMWQAAIPLAVEQLCFQEELLCPRKQGVNHV